MRKFLKILDFCNKWMALPFQGLAGIFGLLWQQDFASYILEEYPERTGLHQIIESYIPVVFIGFFITAGIFSSFRIFTQKSISRLEQDVLDLSEKTNILANNIETLFRGVLLVLSEKIAFTKGEPSRITIYVHNKNGFFIPFGRYSPDPTYERKGRSRLPDCEVCISKAWREDWCFENKLTYREAKRKYKIEREWYESQNMNSVFFAIKRINGNNKQPLAVLVVESKTELRFNENNIKKILEDQESYFSEMIYSLREYIPDPDNATERGF